MQKQLSKHSLLVLTLSILLAVSMCLTATFAAFAQSTNITGTVNFQGGIEIKANGTTDITSSSAGFTIDFTVDLASGNAKTLTGNLSTVTILAGGADYYWKATLTLASTTNVSFNTSAAAVALAGVNDASRTAAVMTWNVGSTAVAGANTTTLNITNLIAALPLTVNYTSFGNTAGVSPTVTATLAINTSLSAIS